LIILLFDIGHDESLIKMFLHKFCLNKGSIYLIKCNLLSKRSMTFGHLTFENMFHLSETIAIYIYMNNKNISIKTN